MVGEGDTAIVHCYDIFGYNAGRTRLMVDQMADAGNLVILPDLYHGDSWPIDKEIGMETFAWVKNFQIEKVLADLTDRVLPYLAEKGAKKVGISGTCWGAWVVLNASTTGKFSAGVSWHPSFQICGIFGGSEVEVAGKINTPQLVLPAENDQANVMKDGDVTKAMIAAVGEDKVEHKVYAGTAHGYMTRGDLETESVRVAVKDGMERAIAFFGKYLKS